MDRNDHSRFLTSRPRAQLRQGRNDWFRIENKDSADNAQVYIYDEIGYFGISANDFVKDLKNVNKNSIELHINTPGGEVFDGIAIYNALKDHPAIINVIIDGIAASIGSVIAMAGDNITMNRSSQMMIHNGHGVAIGDAKTMREMADILDRTSGELANIYAGRTKSDVQSWRDLMNAETWFTAEEAVAAGLADSINGQSSAENSFDLSIFNYDGRKNAPIPDVSTIDASRASEHTFILAHVEDRQDAKSIDKFETVDFMSAFKEAIGG